MNAAEILNAVRQVGATLRVEGESLVASNASRIAPAIKTAIREHKPEVISALLAPSCKVTIVEIPREAGHFKRTFGHLQLKPPAMVDIARWRQCVEDGKRFLGRWGSRAEVLGWDARDLFGLHTPPEKPHPPYNSRPRNEGTGRIGRLQGGLRKLNLSARQRGREGRAWGIQWGTGAIVSRLDVCLSKKGRGAWHSARRHNRM